MKITVKKLPKSEVEIEGELEAEIFETYFGKALKKIGETIKLDGFRQAKYQKVFCFPMFQKCKFWKRWRKWL